MRAREEPDANAQRGGRFPSAAGFTFIEMIVVVTLLAILSAAVVPLYGHSVRALQARSARGDFVALLFFAQELAVRESREVRLCIDDREGTYWLEGWTGGLGEEKTFEPLTEGQNSGLHRFPESSHLSRVRARDDARRNVKYIACMPNGGCDRASIRISGESRGKGDTTIATTGVLGGVEITP